MAVTRYTVTAERSGRWWALQCVEVPGALSQVTRLDQADQIREAIAFVAGVDEDSIEIHLQPVLPEGVTQHLAQAAALREEADQAKGAAAREVRQAAGELSQAGLSMRDIGSVLEVSYQRAHQLVSEWRSAQVSAAHG